MSSFRCTVIHHGTGRECLVIAGQGFVNPRLAAWRGSATQRPASRQVRTSIFDRDSWRHFPTSSQPLMLTPESGGRCLLRGDRAVAVNAARDMSWKH